MGALESLLELLGRPPQGGSPAVEQALVDALTQLSRHAEEAMERRATLLRAADHSAALQATREEEAHTLAARARTATADGHATEGARLEAAAGRARADAEVHADAVGKARHEAAALEEAAHGIQRAVEEGRARVEEVRRHLAQARVGREAAPRVEQGGGDHGARTAQERRQDTDAAFHRLETEQRVDERLAELKRRAGKG